MSTSITSQSGQVSSGQKTGIVQVIVDATRKATEAAIDELVKTGVVNKGNLQRVLAQGNQVADTVVEAVKEKIASLAENIVGRVKRIFGSKQIILKPTDGNETIYKAKDAFVWIDADFKDCGCNVASKPSGQTPVEVYEMIKDGTFAQIFGGFGENLDRLCLTQPQIIQFVKDHSKLLRDEGYSTFFLFKVDSEFFVAFVRWDGGGWGVFASHFSRGRVWRAVSRHRIVVPQLN